MRSKNIMGNMSTTRIKRNERAKSGSSTICTPHPLTDLVLLTSSICNERSVSSRSASISSSLELIAVGSVKDRAPLHLHVPSILFRTGSGVIRRLIIVELLIKSPAGNSATTDEFIESGSLDIDAFETCCDHFGNSVASNSGIREGGLTSTPPNS